MSTDVIIVILVIHNKVIGVDRTIINTITIVIGGSIIVIVFSIGTSNIYIYGTTIGNIIIIIWVQIYSYSSNIIVSKNSNIGIIFIGNMITLFTRMIAMDSANIVGIIIDIYNCIRFEIYNNIISYVIDVIVINNIICSSIIVGSCHIRSSTITVANMITNESIIVQIFSIAVTM